MAHRGERTSFIVSEHRSTAYYRRRRERRRECLKLRLQRGREYPFRPVALPSIKELAEIDSRQGRMDLVKILRRPRCEDCGAVLVCDDCNSWRCPKIAGSLGCAGCARKHAQAARIAQRQPSPQNCKQCGKVFVPVFKSKVCSEICRKDRIKAYNRSLYAWSDPLELDTDEAGH
jgi:predicted Zn-ribbon and HTH transcriptional regulator